MTGSTVGAEAVTEALGVCPSLAYAGEPGVWYAVAVEGGLEYQASADDAFDGAAVFVYTGTPCYSTALACGLGSATFTVPPATEEVFVLVTGSKQTEAGLYRLSISSLLTCARFVLGPVLFLGACVWWRSMTGCRGVACLVAGVHVVVLR